MNIFIFQDEMEIGPYDWVDIAILLHRGELEEIVSARIGSDSKSLHDWGFWKKGSEGGPFSWDEISRLLDAGILDLETEARFAESSKMSNLREVIRNSSEVSLDDISASPPRTPTVLFAIPKVFLARPKTIAAITSFALLLGGLTVLVFLKPLASPRKLALLEEASLGATAQALPEQTQHEPTLKPVSDLPSSTETVATSSQQETPAEPTKIEPVPPQLVSEHPSEATVPTHNQPMATNISSTESGTSISGEAAIVQEPAAVAAPASPATKSTQPSAQNASSKVVASRSPAPEIAATVVGDFFSIQPVKFLKKPPRDGIGVWRFSEDKKKPLPDEFQPCLEVKVAAKENVRSDKLTAKAYFFDGNNTLIASALKPSKAGKQSKRNHFDMPVLFYKDKPDSIFFEVPENIRNSKWKAVIVFGDRHEAQSACFPNTESDFLLDYPEKQLVYDRSTKRVARKVAMDPLIEHLVKTRNPQMPEVTLFLRPPKGVTEASEVKGVLTICVLSNSLEDMKRELRKEEMPGDYAGLFSFANKHKLAIVAWGSRRLWDPGRNYDDLPKEQAREIDKSLDTVAAAWERGIIELGEKYGIPQKNFLLWGNCGSAQWAQRLCLRKPEYFLAIHIHMPGSFDKPTPEAANVLWCLTIGELEGGYERSKRWVKTVREMGYPIVYKAIPGLGHAGHPNAAALGFEFYAFALAHKSELEEDRESNSSLAKTALSRASSAALPWNAIFENPPYYGDMVNQELYPSDDVAMIPLGFRIPLPTKKLADIWARSE